MQEEILNWHKEIFPDVSEQRVLEKVHEELVEFSEESNINDQSYKDELADVIITHIIYYARFKGLSLDDIVKDKFKKVKIKYEKNNIDTSILSNHLQS